GSLFPNCGKAAERLRQAGLNVGVINARFVKPLDRDTLLRALEETPLVVTVEEGTLEGGFGSALLEAANAAGLDTRHLIRLGIPAATASLPFLVRVLRIFVLGNAQRPGVEVDARRLLPFLSAHAEVSAFDLEQQQDLSSLAADIAIVFGGDGAILRAARQMGYR